jgi:nickel/cobalt exporter
MIAEFTNEVFSIWVWLVGVQREISVAIAETLRGYAATGDWRILAGFAPWAVIFGVAHALTPGHSKTVLALYLAGTEARMGPALRSAMTLAAVHISSSVVIVVLALPIVSMARGEAGRALLLEDISRALLGLVGLWLVWSALRPIRDDLSHNHPSHGGDTAFAVFAGLVPCPLTLFVMTFAMARGVPEAGVAFAAMMIVGVGAVLSRFG